MTERQGKRNWAILKQPPELSSLPEEKRLEILKKARRNPWGFLAGVGVAIILLTIVLVLDIKFRLGFTWELRYTPKWLLYDAVQALVILVSFMGVQRWFERRTIKRLVEEETQRAR